ncbi:TonB-dependent siderophore receptor [Bdellovibrio sp. HCB117]|uniref:TonB-dependent siderophore receptor n=1 Tax=Bdellovibrio sp. HCB117 TaxID=3394359 RepID=UPI0039B5A4A0
MNKISMLAFAGFLTLFFSTNSFANETTTTLSESALSSVTISDSQVADSEVSGFFDVSVKELPASLHILSAKKLEENNVQRLSEITTLDASASDSYNAAGYWDALSIRGFTLDNRTSYLRENLPINAETFIALENKEQIDILKGLSGAQVGVSSPGGVVNYKVKRPTIKDLRAVKMQVGEQGSFLTAADVGGRSSSAPQFGYRVNLAQENLAPELENAKGSRSLVSFAGDWNLSSASLLQTEVEWSRRSQPSQAGFSLLGNRLPDPVNPRLNLNNQEWTQPVVFEGVAGSVGLKHSFSSSWNLQAVAGFQNLVTDDRLAYPYGCSAENNYDRYCSDGTYDLYDFRSDDEKRATYSGKVSFDGVLQTAALNHKVSVGVMTANQQTRVQKQAYNYVGVGNVEGTAQLPQDPALTDEGTNRDSKTTDVFVFDNLKYENWNLWLGLRHSMINRESIRTDGSRAVSHDQAFTLPWFALSYDFEKLIAYASVAQGVESFVTPNKVDYTRAGEYVPDVISHQYEVGLRGNEENTWFVTAFHIDRPLILDQKPLYQVDGTAEHQGLELGGEYRLSKWLLEGSAMVLKARRKDASVAENLNDKNPINVPSHTLRAQASYLVSDIKGLTLNTRLVQEGSRAVTADNTVTLPTWTRWDVGASYNAAIADVKTQWRVSVDNVLDARYWKESPEQYGHLYLYPGQARTFWLSLQAAL